jgi:hypothetical protein
MKHRAAHPRGSASKVMDTGTFDYFVEAIFAGEEARMTHYIDGLQWICYTLHQGDSRDHNA